MRKTDREIKDRKDIDGVIRRCRVCRLAVCDDGQPYIVPLNFGYDGSFLYFHAAPEGRKIDIIKRNNKVCFEFDILHNIVRAEQACKWGAKYESVIGSGTAEILEDLEAKKDALEWIMCQYGNGTRDFTEEVLKKTLILRVKVLEISGKCRY
ncbi:MAG: pyridoxamine 5'-phosphate oxidase family protein [Smithella sp.]|jgi:nitroimidazol reductase NimA-like FMN-containing flavoprotein (pyridoxamine 5'-phosphate oxidase superfamily)